MQYHSYLFFYKYFENSHLYVYISKFHDISNKKSIYFWMSSKSFEKNTV